MKQYQLTKLAELSESLQESATDRDKAALLSVFFTIIIIITIIVIEDKTKQQLYSILINRNQPRTISYDRRIVVAQLSSRWVAHTWSVGGIFSKRSPFSGEQ